MRSRFGRSLAAALLAAGAAALASAGCGVERTLQVESQPSGALVYLNGEEAGRTPMRKTFLWYGTYDVQVRKDGYVPRSAKTRVWAPWWQIPPFDFFAELIPLRLQDNHRVQYRLRPVTEQQVDPEQVIERAARLRRRLRSSEYTQRPPEKHKPETQPSEKRQPPSTGK
jgi:hypothetical protein